MSSTPSEIALKGHGTSDELALVCELSSTKKNAMPSSMAAVATITITVIIMNIIITIIIIMITIIISSSSSSSP